MSNEHKITGEPDHVCKEVYHRFLAYQNIYAPKYVIEAVKEWVESGDSLFSFAQFDDCEFELEGVKFHMHNDDFVILEK